MREKQINSTHNSTKYGLLNKMSTPALKEMIKQDCFGSQEDSLDDETIEMILDIISDREQEGREIDVNVLWNNFQSEYVPANYTHEIPNSQKKSFYKSSSFKMPLRRLLIAILLCVLLGNCVAFASRINLFDYIARWTEETFQFQKTDETSFNYMYLYEYGEEKF